MPVLSETTYDRYGASCSSLYLLVGCAFLLVGAVMMSRKLISAPKLRSQQSSSPMISSPIYSEKAELLNHDRLLTHSHSHAPPPLLLSPLALPFTPPEVFASSPSLGEGVEEKLPSNEYYDSPTEMNFSTFDSFEPLKMGGEEVDETKMPRRRSYTKTSSNGGSMSGEILQVSRFPLLLCPRPPFVIRPYPAET